MCDKKLSKLEANEVRGFDRNNYIMHNKDWGGGGCKGRGLSLLRFPTDDEIPF
jgi:hypothetical protein